jgi:hypothetical protein
MEVVMRRHLASLAAVAVVAGAAVFAPAALANSFAVSIGVPGLAVGYANHGGYIAAYAPAPVYYAPPAYYPYYAPAPVYYGAPVVYGGAAYYGGYRRWPHRYYRHW